MNKDFLIISYEVLELKVVSYNTAFSEQADNLFKLSNSIRPFYIEFFVSTQAAFLQHSVEYFSESCAVGPYMQLRQPSGCVGYKLVT